MVSDLVKKLLKDYLNHNVPEVIHWAIVQPNLAFPTKYFLADLATIRKNIRPNKKGSYEKIIVWNHDVDKKDNFLEFEKTILALRKKRDDFKVWVPKMKSSHKLTREYRWITIGKSSNPPPAPCENDMNRIDTFDDKSLLFTTG